MKKKLLVLLGAGSSIPCGMPSVGEIDSLMKQWSRDWEHPPTFLPGMIGDGAFNELWSLLETYDSRHERPELKFYVNFERVLREMIALAH